MAASSKLKSIVAGLDDPTPPAGTDPEEAQVVTETEPEDSGGEGGKSDAPPGTPNTAVEHPTIESLTKLNKSLQDRIDKMQKGWEADRKAWAEKLEKWETEHGKRSGDDYRNAVNDAIAMGSVGQQPVNPSITHVSRGNVIPGATKAKMIASLQTYDPWTNSGTTAAYQRWKEDQRKRHSLHASTIESTKGKNGVTFYKQYIPTAAGRNELVLYSVDADGKRVDYTDDLGNGRKRTSIAKAKAAWRENQMGKEWRSSLEHEILSATAGEDVGPTSEEARVRNLSNEDLIREAKIRRQIAEHNANVARMEKGKKRAEDKRRQEANAADADLEKEKDAVVDRYKKQHPEEAQEALEQRERKRNARNMGYTDSRGMRLPNPDMGLGMTGF